jgi:DNA (cytosine-5)-methyltransferase 1
MTAFEALVLAREARVSVSLADDGAHIRCRSDDDPTALVLDALRTAKQEIVTLIGRWRALYAKREREHVRSFRAEMATGAYRGLIPRVERLKKLGYAFTPTGRGLRALMAAEALERVVTEWLDDTWPGPMEASCCALCGGGKLWSGDPLLPIGVRDHVWVHRNCWAPWHAERRRSALRALESVGIAAAPRSRESRPREPEVLTFCEFFAGSGMARAGLGDNWRCLFANDSDGCKAASYAANWGARELCVSDIENVTTADIPGDVVDLMWGSPPCVGFSEAGVQAGFDDERSQCFLVFLRLVEALAREGRAPRMVVIENVAELLRSCAGADIARVRASLERAGYDCAAAVIDAARFTPQSRERVFVIGAQRTLGVDIGEIVDRALAEAPKRSAMTLADVLQDDAMWHAPPETEWLLALMAPTHAAKVADAQQRSQAEGRPIVGCGYRRMRGEKGRRAQRFEVRFDDMAGGLRTAKGGSSREFVAPSTRTAA